jgi:NADPH:quinone reductase-like Zn-dependent oxidoreductase
MRAVVVEHPGANVLRDIPVPKYGPSDLLVRVVTAGVNPVDWKTRDSGKRTMPFVMGQDFAGRIVEAGQNVRRYALDERIFGVAHEHGAYAEYTVVPEDGAEQPIAGIPDNVGDADAAALPTAGITALGSLDALGAKAGQTIVIVGVTGGVGGYAAQIAKSLGIRVIGVGASAQEHVATALGVDEFVAYDKTDAIDTIARAHPEGVDGFLDLADPPATLDRAINAIRKGGAVVSTIRAANEAHFAKKDISATNVYGLGTPAATHDGLRELARLLESGTLQVRIVEEHPLSEVDRAIASSVSGTAKGKIVLTI